MSANGSSEASASLNQAADSGHQDVNDEQQPMERQVGRTVNNAESPKMHLSAVKEIIGRWILKVQHRKRDIERGMIYSVDGRLPVIQPDEC